jgi:DNA polymerase-3 subunit beta
MDFKISKNDLVKLVSRAASASAAKSPMPILSNIVITAEANGRVTAVGADLKRFVSAVAQCEVAKPGSVALNARTLADIVKKLPAGEARFVEGKADAVELKSGKSKFRLPHLDAADFPAVPKVSDSTQRITLGSRDLARLLNQGAYAAANDESKSFISCARFAIENAGHLAVVSTDGVRFACSELALNVGNWAAIHVMPEHVAMIEREASDHKDASVIISSSMPYAHFEWSDITLSVKLVDDAFPSWRRVVPTSPVFATVNRDMLIDATQRASLVSADDSLILEFVEGTLNIKSDGASKGSCVEDIDITYAGPDTSIRINAKYVLEALNPITADDVELSVAEMLPVLIQGAVVGSECMAVVSPMRIAK